jgi:outer membrane translocation and assembly module TamA
VGLTGFIDTGRVFVKGESSNRWHPGVGAGIWIAPVRRENALRFSFARAEGRTAFYVNIGIPF